MKKPLIVIAGPTACGKTENSIQLAKKIGGEIISADSMQIYKYMDIGTAKIKKNEMENIPHYLIDELYPNDEYNVMIFQQKAKQIIEQIYSRNKVPILVGGTGFYINALVYDNNFMETNKNAKIRSSLICFANKYGAMALHEKLDQIDHDSALAIHPNNVKRVVRALEFYYLTGLQISKHNLEEKIKKSPYNTAFFILNMDRSQLYDRINIRVDKMLKNGLVEEVEFLLQKGYSSDLVSMKGLGYKEIIPFIKGEVSLESAAEELKKGTRHFAKRQLTWFRRQTDGYWIDVTNKSIIEVQNEMLNYLYSLNIINECDLRG